MQGVAVGFYVLLSGSVAGFARDAELSDAGVQPLELVVSVKGRARLSAHLSGCAIASVKGRPYCARHLLDCQRVLYCYGE